MRFTEEDFLSSVTALPSQLYELSVINPLESVSSRTSDREFYLLHVTLPVVAGLGLATVFIIICSVNDMWYDFIQEILNNKPK